MKAWQDAFEFLNHAEKQIAEEKTEAEEAASRLYEAERARGYEDGKAEATRLITETTLKVDRYLQSIEPQVAKLAMSVVNRVLGNFDTRDLVAAAAAHAIVDLRREKGLTVYGSPRRCRQRLQGIRPPRPQRAHRSDDRGQSGSRPDRMYHRQ